MDFGHRDLTISSDEQDALSHHGALLLSLLQSEGSSTLLVTQPSDDYRVVFVNRAAQEFFRLNSEEMSGDWFLRKWQENFGQQALDDALVRLRRDAKVRFRMTHQWPDGSSTPIEIALFLFRFQGVEYIANHCLDITERVRQEKAMHSLRARSIMWERDRHYRHLFEQMRDAVVLLDVNELNGRRRLALHWLNAAASRILNLDADRQAGKLMRDLIGLGFRDSWLIYEHRCVERGETLRFEDALEGDSGLTYYEFELIPILREDGELGSVALVMRDISQRKAEEDERHHQEQTLRTLSDNSPDVIIRYDTDCRRIYVNRTFLEATGLNETQSLGKTPSEVSSLGETGSRIQAMVQRVINTGHPGTMDLRVDKEGGYRVYELRAVPERDRYQQLTSVLVIGRDYSERRQAEDRLHASEQSFRTLVENSPDLICRFNTDYRITYANPATSLITGIEEAELLGMQAADIRETMHSRHANALAPRESRLQQMLEEVMASETTLEFDIQTLCAQGELINLALRLTPEFDREGKLSSILMVGRDTTELNQYQERVQRLAAYDSLTNLPNRTAFTQIIDQVLGKAAHASDQVGLMVLDLDHFKHINDSLGHPVGDMLLKTVANRLSNLVDPSTKIGRLGGDEFGILFPKVESREKLLAQAQWIMDAISHPVYLETQEVAIGVSIGICLFPEDGLESRDMVRYADSALHMAKANGRKAVHCYSRDITLLAKERLTLENDLRQAIRQNQLEVMYQPKIDLHSGRITGAEALVRWRHPTRGLLTPERFIPLAEECGLISALGKDVLMKAAKATARWNEERRKPLQIAVNLSGKQFTEQNLAAMVRDVLAQTHCKASWLELEITEGVLLGDKSSVLAILRELKMQGASIAIDDFGTGYSSLGYLAKFPIDTLKIDKSFIHELLTSRESKALVRAIISMARSLDMDIVAEGVETEAQAIKLATMGCPKAQGFYYGKPMSELAFEAMLDQDIDHLNLL
ncbi:EAL domain-containing protein [Pokkaliibacter sp. CJK22405]|uniref:EAL domain-containing protein n=1 Tax=Pokkaliibacter sp. CJK22405 TaxID=3384615 RepID=UPI0039854673